jgi:hypothetical protein
MRIPSMEATDGLQAPARYSIFRAMRFGRQDGHQRMLPVSRFFLVSCVTTKS